MRTQEELAALHREAEAEFKKYPGVVAVAYGFKLKGGETTQRLAFRIYVEEKKSEAELSPDEIIPPEFRGVLTDVVEISRGRMFAGCQQTDLDGPLVSGITITNLLQDAKGIHIGTLGFFATINGKSGPDNVVYVSNNHVLMAASAHEGDPVSRPKINASNQIVKDQSSQKGVIHKQGKQDNVKYPDATTGQDFWVDAATVKIDVCLSSWCHTNCGTEFKNEVRGLHIDADPANHVVADTKKSIAAVKTLQLSDLNEGHDYIVYKVGRETGLTVGKVTALRVPGIFDTRPGVTAEGLIEIEATRRDCDGTGTDMRFAAEGDSGAALLSSKRELIGIVVGGPDGHPNQAWACHVDPVLMVLEVTPITAAAPHPAEETLSDSLGVVAAARPNQTQELRAKLNASERGRQLFDLVMAHRDEVVHLVNHRRPVTVVWHRSKGPAFLAHAIEGVRDPAHVVPREVEGVTRAVLIENMARVLSEHGSTALREAVGRHVGEALAHAERLDNPHELLEQLDGREEA